MIAYVLSDADARAIASAPYGTWNPPPSEYWFLLRVLARMADRARRAFAEVYWTREPEVRAYAIVAQACANTLKDGTR